MLQHQPVDTQGQYVAVLSLFIYAVDFSNCTDRTLQVDSVVIRASKMVSNGCLGKYTISGRTKVSTSSL